LHAAPPRRDARHAPAGGRGHWSDPCFAGIGGALGGLRKMAAAKSVKVFKVESAQPYGWVVSMEESGSKPHFFINRALATNYARLWARANSPSILRVIDLHGATIKQWSYESVDALYA
jgi:hypothetical protein